MATSNVLLVGLGPHAQKVYLPWLVEHGERYSAKLAAVVDLEQKQEETLAFLSARGVSPQTLFLKHAQTTAADFKQLDKLVNELHINAIIISTEPTAHKAYAMWALSHGLNVLTDKPISARKDAANSLAEAKGLADDYDELAAAYLAARKTHPKLIFSVHAQRRLHPGIQKAVRLTKEVSDQTGVPVTSIHSSHADGQWRLPHELVDIDYHGFTQGFGKASHSGYHFFDLIGQFLKQGISEQKKPDNVEIFTFPRHVADSLAQFSVADYANMFGADAHTPYTTEQIEKLSAAYGETDQFSTMAFKKGDRTITSVQLSLQHTSLSSRAWIEARPDLYKGNGRLKHEQHTIQQGALQTIQIHSFQAQSNFAEDYNDDYKIGGVNHFDVHIFRNTGIIGGPAYEKVSINQLIETKPSVDILTYTVRAKVLVEFFDYLNGKIARKDLKTELTDHAFSAHLMSAAYVAQIMSKQHKSFTTKVTL